MAGLPAFLIFMQETAENIVYADVGPLLNNRPQSTENTIDFDEHRVEYAQLNHKVQVSVPISDKETKFNEGVIDFNACI